MFIVNIIWIYAALFLLTRVWAKRVKHQYEYEYEYPDTYHPDISIAAAA